MQHMYIPLNLGDFSLENSVHQSCTPAHCELPRSTARVILPLSKGNTAWDTERDVITKGSYPEKKICFDLDIVQMGGGALWAVLRSHPMPTSCLKIAPSYPPSLPPHAYIKEKQQQPPSTQKNIYVIFAFYIQREWYVRF